MKRLFLASTLLLVSMLSQAQIDISKTAPVTNSTFTPELSKSITEKKIRIQTKEKWRMTGNRYLTGSLFFLAGASKGFNETLQYNYNGFQSIFPKANDQWFYPTLSFRNKYKDGDPAKGAKFPLSTSVLVMFTDQYHLNNFIQRASLTAAIVIKIGEGKKPLKHYVFDVLYYSACHQLGFASIYYPIKARNY